MRTFAWLAAGQLISTMGSALTRFALSVWVYEVSGSATRFTIVALCGSIEFLVFPWAGLLVDRMDRRRVMLICDAVALAAVLCAAFLFVSGSATLLGVALFNLVSSAASGVRVIAVPAAAATLVPSRELSRTAAITNLSWTLPSLVAPALGGVLLGALGVRGVLLMDAISFVLSMGILLRLSIPDPPRTSKPTASFASAVLSGWTFLRARPGLLGLSWVIAVFNMFTQAAMVLITPLVLATFGPRELGTILTVGGMGAFLSSVGMSVWAGPKSRVLGVLLSMAVGGAFLAIAGARPSVAHYTVCAFCAFACIPISNACSQAIAQAKTPADLMGRVLAVRRTLFMILQPVAYLGAGPLADALEPAMRDGGALASSAGSVLGVGPGRGIALLFAIVGTMAVAVALLGLANGRIRRLEEQIPDAPS
jgi:MFS family permease